MKQKNFTLTGIIALALCAGVFTGCRKDTILTETKTTKQSSPNNAMTVNESGMIGIGQGLPKIVDFFNQAISSEGVTETYSFENFTQYAEPTLNYIFIEENAIGSPILQKEEVFEVPVNLINGQQTVTSNNINTTLTIISNYLKQVAIENNFRNDELLYFKNIFVNPINLTNETPGFRKIKLRTLIARKIIAMPQPCMFDGDFASLGTRPPNANDGSCFKGFLNNNPNKPLNYWADDQINNKLNNAGNCNTDIKCIQILDLRGQSSSWNNIPVVFPPVLIKLAGEIKYTNNDKTTQDPNLWKGPEPYTCLSVSQMDNYYAYTLTQSLVLRPTYQVPNSTLTIPKSIVGYYYEGFQADGYVDNFGNFLPFNGITRNHWMHYARINYQVCAYMPLWVSSTKKDWRTTI